MTQSHLPILCEICPKMYVAIINEMGAGNRETPISQIFEFIVFNIQIGVDVSMEAIAVSAIENAPAAIIM